MYLLLFLFLGFGAGAYVVIVNIADYPAPEIVGRLWMVLAAGPVGSLIGGFLFQNMIVGSNPMPGGAILSFAAVLGVIGAGLGASAGTALLAGFGRRKGQVGR